MRTFSTSEFEENYGSTVVSEEHCKALGDEEVAEQCPPPLPTTHSIPLTFKPFLGSQLLALCCWKWFLENDVTITKF